jgi:hypothetical protein
MMFNINPTQFILRRISKILSYGLILFFFILYSGCENQPANPLDSYHRDLPAPDHLSISLQSTGVTLFWDFPQSIMIEKFVILRQVTDSSEFQIAGETRQKYFIDQTARNQQRYAYQVQAIGTGGHLSPRSSAIQVTPNQFAISIIGSITENPASPIQKFTNQAAVNIHCTAPAETDSLWLSNDSTQLLQSGRLFSSDIAWILPPGEGIKRVFARFKASTNPASYILTSDRIAFDTRAQILNIFENSGGRSLTTSDTLHLRMVTLDRFGTAQVMIGNWQIELYNNGTHGDQIANDNVFEVQIAIPHTVQENQSPVSGRFVDLAGNEVQYTLPLTLLTINNAPSPVQLLPVADIDTNVITLRWTENTATDFASYQIFHSNQSEMYEGLSADTIITQRNQTRYCVRWLSRNQYYYFRIMVTNLTGFSSWSNEIVVQLKSKNGAPNPILLAHPQIICTDSIRLTWSQSWEDNFAAYYIYRSEQPISQLPVTPMAIVNQRVETAFIDFNLLPNRRYYYRIAVFNRANQYTLSNQVNIQLQP